MCNSCGCATHQSPTRTVQVDATQHASIGVFERLLAQNDLIASHNRHHFDTAGSFVINLMSAPGSGKTALLEATIDLLKGRFRIAVIEGDLETENDAARIRRHGVPAVQITTGTACHLDAAMIHGALHDMRLDGVDLLFIENVGNLVCPAAFDLGQHCNVTLLSVPEGDDKPAKYPIMFRASDLIIISKADLLPYFDDFSPSRAETHVRDIGCAAPIFDISVRRQDGLNPWLAWLEQQIETRRSQNLSGSRTMP